MSPQDQSNENVMTSYKVFVAHNYAVSWSIDGDIKEVVIKSRLSHPTILFQRIKKNTDSLTDQFGEILSWRFAEVFGDRIEASVNFSGYRRSIQPKLPTLAKDHKVFILMHPLGSKSPTVELSRRKFSVLYFPASASLHRF